MTKHYVFKPGEGEEGIPGLPWEITDDEARALGVEELLKDAIKAGKYIETKPEKPAKEGD